MTKSAASAAVTTRELILHAAREILLTDGLVGISTRRVARQADVNQALIHYHFGSIEQLLVEVSNIEASLVSKRSADIFSADAPLPTKWRTYVNSFINDDFPEGGLKIWLECVAMVLNSSERAQVYVDTIVAPNHERVRKAVTAAVSDPSNDFEIEGLTALITAAQKGLFIDRLLGFTNGHAELIDLIDRLLVARSTSDAAGLGSRPSGRRRRRVID